MALHAWPRGGYNGCERRRLRASLGSSTAHGTPHRVHFHHRDRRFSDPQNPKNPKHKPSTGEGDLTVNVGECKGAG